ncbi:MAG: hypothetical protein MUQ10_10315 [Anaerolineae bacterium]|nr:hypothetical protein [Anaerolineae bacterium]
MFSFKLATLAIVFAVLATPNASAYVAPNSDRIETPGSIGPDSASDTVDDLVFIHHSSGEQWLVHSLNDALVAKDYIDERNDITYDDVVPSDTGQPSSLGSISGDNTDMNHWILWFNDYLENVKGWGTANGYNQIIMFKSCYPESNVSSDGTEPGDPFSSSRTLANYRAVYRHPDGPGHTYSNSGYEYLPLENIFAANPNILFIPVTAAPLHYEPDATTDDNAARAREFNNWLKNEWLTSYNAAHPGLHNVAVFDWFNLLAYPDTHPDHPNRLKFEYGGSTGNSHPNATAHADSTEIFATDTDPLNFIDTAWRAFSNNGVANERTLQYSQFSALPTLGEAGGVVTFTAVLRNPGPPLPNVLVTGTLSSELDYRGDLLASAGSYGESIGVISWTGTVDTVDPVTITFSATISETLSEPEAIVAMLSIDDGEGTVWQRQATVIVNGQALYLPVIRRNQ